MELENRNRPAPLGWALLLAISATLLCAACGRVVPEGYSRVTFKFPEPRPNGGTSELTAGPVNRLSGCTANLRLIADIPGAAPIVKATDGVPATHPSTVASGEVIFQPSAADPPIQMDIPRGPSRYFRLVGVVDCGQYTKYPVYGAVGPVSLSEPTATVNIESLVAPSPLSTFSAFADPFVALRIAHASPMPTCTAAGSWQIQVRIGATSDFFGADVYIWNISNFDLKPLFPGERYILRYSCSVADGPAPFEESINVGAIPADRIIPANF